MNGRPVPLGPRRSGERSTVWQHRSCSARGVITAAAAGWGLGILSVSPSASAQTLNEAVAQELAIGPVTQLPCEELLGNDPVTAFQSLTGELRNICGRFAPMGGSFPSSAGGGGAATPVQAPAIVERRLLRAIEEEEEIREDGGASADVSADLGGGLSVYLSGEFGNLDKDITTFEDGYDSDVWRLVPGADVQITNSILLGVAFDLFKQSGDYSSGGTFETKSYGVIGYGSVSPIDQLFIQGSVGYALKTNDRTRIASFTEIEESSGTVIFSTDGPVGADFDGNEFTASVLTGYDVPIANVTITPRVGVNYFNVEYDTYSETGDTGLELTFHDDSETSLQSTLGMQGAVALSTSLGVIIPQASVDWIHEFRDDQRNVQVSFVDDLRSKRFTYQTEKPDRDFFEINAGVVVVLPYGIQAFGNYNTLVGHRYFDTHTGTLGLRVDL